MDYPEEFRVEVRVSIRERDDKGNWPVARKQEVLSVGEFTTFEFAKQRLKLEQRRMAGVARSLGHKVVNSVEWSEFYQAGRLSFIMGEADEPGARISDASYWITEV